MMRKVTALLALLAAALLVVACGDDGEDVQAGSTGTDGTTAGQGDSQDGTDDTSGRGGADRTPGDGGEGLFVEVAHVGGFTVPLATERQVPAAVVMADGTVFAPGAITLQYPGPAVLPVMTGRIGEDDVRGLLRLAAGSGLLDGDVDLGDESLAAIADAPTTRVTIIVDGVEHVLEAYALGLEGEPDPFVELTEEQRAAREALAELVGAVTTAASAAQEPWDPDRYQVVAADPALLGDGEPAPNELAWPAELPHPAAGACVTVAGPQADALEALLGQATEITRWLVADQPLALAIRPLLPHEAAC